LQHDHARLRGILALMEQVIHVGAPAWPILQEACVTLSGELQRHVDREAPWRSRSLALATKKGAAGRTIPNHRPQVRQLRVLSQGLLSHAVTPKDIDVALYAIIADLQQQMDQQEQQLVPVAGDARMAPVVFHLDAADQFAHLYHSETGGDPNDSGWVA